MPESDQEKRLKEVNLLDLTPVRIAEWEESGDRVVVLRPKPRGSGLGRLYQSLIYVLSARRIRLDATGSRVWLLMDGRRTVADLASDLRADFGDEVEPAEERVGHLIRVLRREGLVAYPGWDELPSGPTSQ